MYRITVRRVDDSQGTTQHEEVLDELKVSGENAVFIKETSDGVKLFTYDPNFEENDSTKEEILEDLRQAWQEVKDGKTIPVEELWSD